MIENNNIWSFPLQIAFEMVPLYSKKFEEMSCNQQILFDLSRTDYIHSSFIGFLINAKQKTDAEGGSLKIHISPELEKLFVKQELKNFFQFHCIKKSA
jgi:anti-anti-sigma regulatory factor